VGHFSFFLVAYLLEANDDLLQLMKGLGITIAAGQLPYVVCLPCSMLISSWLVVASCACLVAPICKRIRGNDLIE
jgi:hypothetical protein